MIDAWEVGKGRIFAGTIRKIRVSRVTHRYVYLENGRNKLALHCQDHEIYLDKKEALYRRRMIIAERLEMLHKEIDALVKLQHENNAAIDDL